MAGKEYPKFSFYGRIFCIVMLLAGIFYYNTEYSYKSHKVLNIYCWDDSLKKILETYYPAYHKETQTIGDVKVHWIMIPGTDNIYQTMVDKAIAESDESLPDERIDLFLVEADYVRKYTRTPEAAKSLAELGITESELADQFSYTREAAMDAEGIQRGISWQATPGVLIYRRDIARRVFGTDDPEQVQALVADWPAFEGSAARVRAAGFYMLAGYFDTYRVFASRADTAWINDKKEIVLNDALRQWRDQTARLVAQDQIHTNDLWDQDWNKSVRGDVFCYFGPAWLINHALQDLSLETSVADGGTVEKGNGTFGEWAVCRGPQPYFWGGTWICAAKGTDNADLVADIMRTICCNKEVALEMAQKQTEFVNHRSIMQKLANDSSFGIPFLDGQNAYEIMNSVADTIRVRNLTPYDQGIHEAFQSASREYFAGIISKERSWQKFLATVWLKYPELQNASRVR